MDDSDKKNPGGEKNQILGDVVVNVHRAWDDAEEAGSDPLSEVAFLIIHGICHLAGYDHEGSQAHRAAEMEEMENRLHEKYGAILSKTEDIVEKGN
jgi:probable rRNA maturation factor